MELTEKAERNGRPLAQSAPTLAGPSRKCLQSASLEVLYRRDLNLSELLIVQILSQFGLESSHIADAWHSNRANMSCWKLSHDEMVSAQIE